MFVPLVPAMIGGAIWVIFVAYLFGVKERKRVGTLELDQLPQQQLIAFNQQAAASEVHSEKRPKLIWINFALTVLLLLGLIMGIMPLPALFMIGFALAIVINYPNLEEQKERIKAHAGNVLAVVSLVFAAGAFTGILSGTKMVDAMANSLVALIPDALGSYLPIITALTSMPFYFFMSNDAYYFGMLPIIAEAATSYGINPVEIARASLIGQPVHLLSPLVASNVFVSGYVKSRVW